MGEDVKDGIYPITAFALSQPCNSKTRSGTPEDGTVPIKTKKPKREGSKKNVNVKNKNVVTKENDSVQADTCEVKQGKQGEADCVAGGEQGSGGQESEEQEGTSGS